MLEVRRIDYTIMCSKRELVELYERGIETMNDGQLRRNDSGFLVIGDDPIKEYGVILSPDELETLQCGLCCDSASDLRKMIRREVGIKAISKKRTLNVKIN
jgi:hypothetical protein